MNKQQLLLVINPISGTSKKEGLADVVSQRILSSLRKEVDVKITTKKGDAYQFACEAVEKGYYGVIAVGGDGTINEVATALCNSDVVLGIIPTGSGNGLARHLDIPIDVKRSLDVICKNNVRPFDFATVNGIPFFCTFGVGFDAAVSERFSKQGKRGKFMYVKSIIEEYKKYNTQVYTIKVDDKILTEDAFIVTCCNASQYGNNAYIAPSASMTDGLLDVVIIHKGSPFDVAALGFDLFTGYINKNTLLQSFKAANVVISRTQDGPAHVDGDPMIVENVMDIKCHHSGLKIFVPKKQHKHFYPIITPLTHVWGDMCIALSKVFK